MTKFMTAFIAIFFIVLLGYVALAVTLAAIGGPVSIIIALPVGAAVSAVIALWYLYDTRHA